MCEINIQDLTANHCHSLMQKRVKTRNCYSKEEDKDKATVVPLTRDQVQMRLSRSKQIGLKKEEKTPARRRGKR